MVVVLCLSVYNIGHKTVVFPGYVDFKPSCAPDWRNYRASMFNRTAGVAAKCNASKGITLSAQTVSSHNDSGLFTDKQVLSIMHTLVLHPICAY